MIDRLRAELDRLGVIVPGRPLVVGYSGGADSACLLDLLHKLEVDVIAAHLHHGMRAEADDELLQCEKFCEQRGIPFLSGKADVPQMARDLRVGLEEAGRWARRQFFRQVMHQVEASWTALAHTEDDQIETVLFHMARGTGLHGLIGIPGREDGICHPMLSISREETRSYCAAHSLWFHDDPANQEIEFARVRLRHRVIPEFESVHPGFRQSLIRLSEIAAEEDAFLNGIAANSLEGIEQLPNGNLAFLTRDCEVILSRAGLTALPAVLQKRCLRLIAQYLGAEPSFDQIALIVKALGEDGSGSITFEEGEVVTEILGETIHLRQLLVDEVFRFPLTVPGDTESDHFGWKLTAQSWDPGDFKQEPGSLEVVIDPDASAKNLHFRSLEPGDRIEPLGMEGTKLISDLLNEAGLTLAARRRLPIICDMAGPIWVPGVRMSGRVKVTDRTKRGLKLSFGPLQDPSWS